MIQIYTTPSCSSCRKAKKWLDKHKIEYREKNIFNVRLTRSELFSMLKNTENGFEDIISTRAKLIVEGNLNLEEMSMNELADFIIDNPSILRRPIIVEDDKLQVGYNEDDIRIFLPKRLRQIIMVTTCDEGEECVYQNALNMYLNELKLKDQYV